MAWTRALPALALAGLLLAVPGAALRAETAPAQPAVPAQPALPTQPELPAEPAPNTQVWWVSPAGIALGPYSVAELLALAGEGALALDTPVWREGMAEWQLLGDSVELASVKQALSEAAAQDADEAARLYLLGTWVSEGGVYQDGVRIFVTARYDYRANGSFVAVESALPSGVGAQTNVEVIKGNWGVKVAGESRIEVLHVYPDKEGKEEVAEVYDFEIIAQDTMRDTQSGLYSHRER